VPSSPCIKKACKCKAGICRAIVAAEEANLHCLVTVVASCDFTKNLEVKMDGKDYVAVVHFYLN
jgi:hypothetical protein